MISVLFIILSFALPVNAWIGEEEEERIIGEFLSDIPLGIKGGLISNSYRAPSGEILTTSSDQEIQWSLAIIFAQGERVGDAASLLATRGLFHQMILRDLSGIANRNLSEIAFDEDIKNDLAHYLLAQQTDYSIGSIEEKKTMENNGMTAVLIKAPINGLNYQVNDFEIGPGFYRYLITKADFLDYNNDIDRAINRLKLIYSGTENKNLQLVALLKKAKIHSKSGEGNYTRESLATILNYEDINLYRAYGSGEFKELVRLMDDNQLQEDAIEMAAFALTLFPEETYFEEVILGK